MAKKRAHAGPNKAERRALVKQQREEQLRRQVRRKTTRAIRNVVIGLIIVGAIVGLVINSKLKSNAARGQLESLAAAAGCSTLQHPADQGNQPHLAATENFSYNSNPPTSGRHDPAPGQTGTSGQAIPDRNQVHNLEHGHIGIQYNGIDPSILTALEQVVRENDTRIFMAPRLQLDAKLALTAWDNLIKCQNPNAKVADLARAFVRGFVGKGPEGDIPGTPG